MVMLLAFWKVRCRNYVEADLRREGIYSPIEWLKGLNTLLPRNDEGSSRKMAAVTEEDRHIPQV